MFSTIISAAIHGIEAVIVHVEVDIAQGLPCFMMVGYLSSQVKEAGERVRVALKNSGITIPPMRITVNLSPADIRKDGTAFDLPVAVGILQSLGHITEECTRKTMIVGELSLDGAVNPIRGVLPLVRKAKEEGYVRCLVPKENGEEGAAISEIDVISVSSISEVLNVLKGEKRADKKERRRDRPANKEMNRRPDFAEINGQAAARRAVEIAAAGFHHILLIGPPGAGKTMIAERIPGILPELSQEESLEVSSVYSISGLLNNKESLIVKRPLMAPHHTITAQAFTGGGRIPKPGIISLAHKGVLFLDEMPEFKQNILDMLRQPLEEKKIHIARLEGSYTYPADFMLVGAMNPCPCGYYPDISRCRCTSAAIKRYQSHISGPILDRIDICAELPQIAMEELTQTNINESSDIIRKRVMKARGIQEERYKEREYRFNSGLPSRDIGIHCMLEVKEKKLMEQAFLGMKLSARAYYRILRVARTVADLDGSERIREIHLAEAINCRVAGREYWEK